MADITTAKRLIAAHSMEGLRLLGAGVSRPCYQGRYNLAATAALSDPKAGFTQGERDLVAAFIEGEEEEDRSFMLRVRLTELENEQLRTLADEAGLSMSEYVRARVFAAPATALTTRGIMVSTN